MHLNMPFKSSSYLTTKKILALIVQMINRWGPYSVLALGIKNVSCFSRALLSLDDISCPYLALTKHWDVPTMGTVTCEVAAH